ncbi:MAG: acVLRF1 family peptidyl-tRNA hydrolase [Actinomycetes bacterium]
MTPHGTGRPISTRTAFVPGGRLAGWAGRFGAAHGGYLMEDGDDGLRLMASDGTEALLQAPWPVDGRPGRGRDALERLASLASQPRRLGLLLVRRGGYGVGVAGEGLVLASKVGSTYVQSRTAAGGQSQQRFARRRSNQAEALVDAVAEQAARVFGSESFEYVVPGGDRTLAALVLQHPSLTRFAGLPRLTPLDVPDPKAAVLKKAAADACSIRIQVTDAGAGLSTTAHQ